MLPLHQRLTAIALLALTSATAAVPESEVEPWSELEEQRAEQFMELLFAETLDVEAALTALEQFSDEQRRQLIGPVEIEGETYWPLSATMVPLFVDGDSDNAGEFIEFGEAMAQRLTSDEQRGHWLAVVSRTRLHAGANLDLAREAALQARALGTDLCRGDCGPLVEAWLSGEDVDGATGKLADLVFDPRPASCADRPGLHVFMVDPGAFSDEWLRLVLGRLENAVATDMDLWWRAAGRGCEAGNAYSLQSRIDGEYPPMLVQQSYASAERAVGLSQPPKSVSFLGHVLPLPSRECDFAKAADCSVTQPLRAKTARALVHQLRGLSGSLRPVAMCMPGREGDDKHRHDALAKRFGDQIETLAKAPAADAILGLETLLVDDAFQPLKDERASYEVRDLLVATALAGESERALRLWQNILPTLEQPRAAHQQLLAKLLLHRQRADEAATLLERLSSSGADDSAGRAWLQLRAALEGADLAVAALAPMRPWHAVLHEVDNDWSTGIQSEVNIDDVLIGTLTTAELIDHLLPTGWVASIESPWIPTQTLLSALHHAYPGERWAAELEAALNTLSGEPEPGFVLAGRWLPLPDQWCDEDGCRPTDRAGLRALLVARGWLPSESDDGGN
jgi:hypothetical protein